MIKTLTNHGNSAALVIDKAILDLLGINMATPLKLSTDGKSLIISPVPNDTMEFKIRNALARANNVYADAFPKFSE